MDSKTYWIYVDRAEEKLKEDHKRRAEIVAEKNDFAKWEGQPANGKEIFLVSLTNYDRGTTEGTVYVLYRRLAAQRIVEGTHRVANATEIKEHLDRLERNRRDIDLLEMKRNRQFMTQVPYHGSPVDTQSPEFTQAVMAAAKAAVEEMLGAQKATKK